MKGLSELNLSQCGNETGVNRLARLEKETRSWQIDGLNHFKCNVPELLDKPDCLISARKIICVEKPRSGSNIIQRDECEGRLVIVLVVTNPTVVRFK